MSLPSLDNLAYRVDDDGDHLGGGHCAGLGGEDTLEDRIALVGQYSRALEVVARAAAESDDGWSMGRPILFMVHQLCEAALAVAVNPASGKIPVPQKRKNHDLVPLFNAAIAAGAYDGLTDSDRDWCRAFIDFITPITVYGFMGRVADKRLAGGMRLDDVWCCINPLAMAESASQFSGLTIRRATEIPR